MEAKGNDPRAADLDANSFLWMIQKSGVTRILTTSFLGVVRFLADRLPKKMSLGYLRIISALLVIIMPRSFTYVLLYPLFRLVFGNLYPAYASYKAVRTKNVKEYVKWMMYWIVFALFTCAETFTDVFFSFWFPFYYEIKTILVIWLLSPATKGSSILYRRFVHPALIRREAEIDDALARATEQGYTAVLHLGSKGVNYATTVLMQTAIKQLLKTDQMVSTELTSGIQSGSPVSRPVRPPTPRSTKDETDLINDLIRDHLYPSTSSEEYIPVEPMPSLPNEITVSSVDMNNASDDDVDDDDDDDDEFFDTKPVRQRQHQQQQQQQHHQQQQQHHVFKAPRTPNKGKKRSETRNQQQVRSRRLRSHTRKNVYGYSDDDLDVQPVEF